MSSAARLAGALAIAAAFVILEALVVGYRGARPSVFNGVEIGSLIGLASLVLEIQVVARAMRSATGDPAGATFQTFAMRLAIVAPLTFAFQRKGSSVDSESFALGYLITFFVYLCWLTWTTYHAPVHYKGKSKQFAPRVVEKRCVSETAASAR